MSRVMERAVEAIKDSMGDRGFALANEAVDGLGRAGLPVPDTEIKNVAESLGFAFIDGAIWVSA